MKKKDILAAFIIGEGCSLIFLLILKSLEVPSLVTNLAKFFPIILPVLSILGIYIASLAGKKASVLFQAAKSFLAGILNTFIDLGILTLLMETFKIFSGLFYIIFKAISFSCATINSYFWNKFWAFEKRETKEALKETSQFYFITIGGLLINLGVSSFIVNILGPQFGISEKLWAYVGAIAAVFFGFVWNFLGYKFIVFKK